MLLRLWPFGNLGIGISALVSALAGSSSATFKYKNCLLNNINQVLCSSKYFLSTCNVFSNVSWQYLITKIQYLISIFLFPNILDPVNNIAPKVLLTSAFTFVCCSTNWNDLRDHSDSFIIKPIHSVSLLDYYYCSDFG